MDPILFPVLLLVVVLSPVVSAAAIQPTTSSHITVTGSVFCDVCYNNAFTKYSYFLPGADVHVECRFEGNEASSKEQISFSVNRTTNKYGVYRMDIPSVEGVDCVEGPAIQSLCEATLIKSSSAAGCNVPGVSTTTKEITLKSRSTNNHLCVYSLSALSYRPFQKNSTLCGAANYQQQQQLLSSSDSFNSSKFFLPYFPWPLPPFPQLPPLPQLPPFPQLPPLPQLPPFPQLPPLQFPPNFPPPPVFNLGDPRTWIALPPPSPPPPPPPPPPPFSTSDPRSWVPRNPFLIPSPPPPGFDLRDPRTWIPTSPPYSPPQNHQP